MESGPVDVALVQMPYSEVGQPSLALGLLRADCDRRGVVSRAIPASLWFSEEIGPAAYDMIFQAYSTTLIGEWTFAAALFPEFQPDDEKYLRKVVGIFRVDARAQWRHLHERYPFLDYVALLRHIRSRAAGFVERAADRILALEPKIVGCSSTFQQHCASLALLRTIKQRRPDVVTMIGGANCEGDMGRVTFEQYPWVDFVASGEGDGFFGALCARIIAGGAETLPAGDLPEGVWGPAHRRGDGALHCPSAIDGAPIARLEDMDDSPVPNYDDYFSYLAGTQSLRDWVRPALPFQTARGCWWGEKSHCTFCGISRTAMKFRAKSGDNVLEQMAALRDKYGITNFQGTEYIFDYRYFDTLLPRLQEIGGHFRFEVKANLKPEQLHAFVRSGTLEVQPGVESLHDRLLGLLKKGTTAWQNLLLLKRGRKVGLLVYWNLLHGIPGEQDDWYMEMADLIPLVTHLQAPAGVAQVHYDRFSPYWRDPAAHGLELEPAFGYRYVYPFSDEVLRDVAYFFETPRQRDSFLRLKRKEQAGLLRLLTAVGEWRAAWESKRSAPTLFATDQGDSVLFEDTRAVSTAPRFVAEGLEARVYRLAEGGLFPAALVKAIREETPEVDERSVESAVARLVERKVLAMVSGRWLALGILTPVPPFLAHTLSVPRAEANPGWARLMADRALDQIRPNIALSCLQEPTQEPLDRWMAPASSQT